MQSIAQARARHQLGRAALYYAVHFGWAVFPLRPGRKTPLIPRAQGGHGCLQGTTDPKQVTEWWQRWPHANIGLSMGLRSNGLFALDVDPRNGGDLLELLESFGPLPETVQALTGGGGVHVLLRGEVGCGVLMPGVEVKGEGGYVVVSPSVHPDGQPYLWEASSRPGEVAIADAPQHLLQAIGAARPPRQPRPVAALAARHLEPGAFVLGAAFVALNDLGPQIKPGVWAVRCPNRAQHTCGHDFDSSTVLFAPPRAGGHGRFKCLHSHCGHLA